MSFVFTMMLIWKSRLCEWESRLYKGKLSFSVNAFENTFFDDWGVVVEKMGWGRGLFDAQFEFELLDQLHLIFKSYFWKILDSKEAI